MRIFRKSRRKLTLREASQREIGDSGRNKSRADQEDELLGSGRSKEEIKDAARVKEAARQEKFRDHVECVAVLTLYLVFGAAVILGVVWLYHLIAFEIWPRIPERQLDKIQTIITGGAIIGAVKEYFKKRVGN